MQRGPSLFERFAIDVLQATQTVKGAMAFSFGMPTIACEMTGHVARAFQQSCTYAGNNACPAAVCPTH
jgi:hypothetical protein